MKITSLMMTSIYIQRREIISKEAMEDHYKGYLTDRLRDSVNDDIESLMENLRLGIEPDNQWVYTYFLPKLTEEEMELAEKRDYTYEQTFWLGMPDVREEIMKLSKSDSKFTRVLGRRRTFTIKNSQNCCNLQ